MFLSQAFIILAFVLAVLVLAQLGVALFEFGQKLSLAGTVERQERQLFELRLRTAKRRQKQQENAAPWNGIRKFKIDRVVPECEGVQSFYLVPHDHKPLPGFHPGQYLTFELDIPGQSNRVVRCYSLSDRPRSDYYRVTVKRIPAPAAKPETRPGLVSNFFHTQLKAGDIVDVKAPGGGFHLDVNQTTPVVLLGGGVGLTPLMSMLSEIVENTPQRQVWLFYAVRNRAEHILKETLEAIARENNNVRLQIIYSKPKEDDGAGRDYHHCGRLNLALLKQQLPSNNFDFYLCGPGEMMSDLSSGLREWGVPEKSIHLEAFGPASVQRLEPPVPAGAAGETFKVTFARTQKDSVWTPQSDSLLDLALAEKAPVSYGCRAGNCGTCKTAIKSGKVKHLKEPGCEVEAGSCLMCICVPESNVVLEA